MTETVQPVSDAVAPEDNVTVLPVLMAPGGRLRAAREAAGLGIGHVVEALRVEPHLVEAMEANRFELFDAPVYARGFLRKYSEFLGLSAGDMLAEFDSLSSRPAAPTHVPLTTAAPRVRDWSRVQSTLVIAGALVIVIGSFLWWHDRSAAPALAPAEPLPARVAEAPAPATAPVAAGPVDSAREAAAPPAEHPAAAQANADAPVADASATPPAVPAAAAQPQVTPAETASSPAVETAAAGAAVSLAFELSGDSWVEIYGADGARQFQALLHAGERRSLYGRGPWRVLLGKADHVRVLVDGRTVAPGEQFRKGETALYHVDARGNVY